MQHAQKIQYVSRDGYALDDKGNEIQDATGAAILISEDERANYDLAYRPNEEPDENE